MISKHFIFVISLAIATASFAVEGKIAGRVVDSRTLEPLIGANVLVVGTQTGAATDTNGEFIIENMRPGSYNLEIRYLGYSAVKRSNIIVNPKRTTVIEVAMELSAIEGESVQVTAGYFEKPKEAIVSTRSMNFEEIRRSPGDLVDIQRAMQALPSVVSGSDQLNEIIIRGGYPGENLFVLDNIEIPNPNHFAVQGAGGGPINLLNSYMVRNVDFYAGAFSAKFGDRASSVMDMSLRNGSQDHFRWEGNLGMAGAGLLLEGPVGQKASFMFSARKSYLDLVISSTGLTAVPQYHNAQGKLTYKLNDANTLLVNAVYGTDNINIEEGDEAGYGRGAENIDTRNSQIIGGATLRTFWNKKLYSYTTLSAVSSDFFVDVYRMPGRETFFTNESRETEYAAKSDFVWQAHKKLEVNAGLSLKALENIYNVQGDADTLFVYDVSGASPDSIIDIFRTYPEYRVDNTINSSKTAGYVQLSYDLAKRLRFTGGLRYDYFEFNDFFSLSPRVGFSFGLSPITTFNIAYGRHYQSPYPVELAAHPANNTLRNKYTNQYVVGLEHFFRDDIKLTLEAYYKKYLDIPVKKNLTTPDPFDFDDGTFINAAEGQAQGVEMFLQKKLTEKFSTIMSYAHSASQTLDPRFETYYPSDYDYRDVFTFIGGYKYRWYETAWYQKLRRKPWYFAVSWLPFMPADEFEISLKWRYLGGRPYTQPVYYPELQRWVVEEQQELNTRRYPPYHRLDLRLDRRFLFQTWTLVVFFDIINVYNRDNIWNYQYNDDGTISQVLQYKTFPVGGVTVEF
ncbi:TonB-dependent receptor [candidate division KSB1 bacterium]|nr:TonB-dependent receptor [candidate division KSB1 bacterium]RQW07113.1 MAG: TonB-dependent receptor [candidate division KSB1 bacterium]